ncbi:hypothetical protein LCGC14_1154040 [marine sediment metagenome]|uniref:Uncharacterized protein n=1 Tax=marine sediment metagenome TaxID=412755 RepID=A0A0F9MHV8_9ZZZZ
MNIAFIPISLIENFTILYINISFRILTPNIYKQLTYFLCGFI